MEHKWLRNFDEHGVWTKPTRDIRVEINGVITRVDMDEYAKEKGIELPDSKFYNKKDKKVEKHEDMGQALEERDSEES
jgi:hypothetical protein